MHFREVIEARIIFGAKCQMEFPGTRWMYYRFICDVRIEAVFTKVQIVDYDFF